LHLLGEGQHWKSYEKLGAQLRTVDGIQGVKLRRVGAKCGSGLPWWADFNVWTAAVTDAETHSGRVWELLYRALERARITSLPLKHRGGHVVDKCDPYGYFAEVPPRTANIVTDLNSHK